MKILHRLWHYLFNTEKTDNKEAASPRATSPYAPERPVLHGATREDHFFEDLLYRCYQHRCQPQTFQFSNRRNQCDEVNAVLNSAPYGMDPYLYLFSSAHVFKNILRDFSVIHPIPELLLDVLVIQICDRWVALNANAVSVESARYVNRKHIHTGLLNVREIWNRAVDDALSLQGATTCPLFKDSDQFNELLATMLLEFFELEIEKTSEPWWPKLRHI